ncbi:hypothetical protein SH601_14450 [Gracilibacillus sp. S3-1-1]|uniref:Uncharacterized protein n=1 Tax=Gracilibacillus pellucidus TaxID=3095368 RepID=A0ACC6M876_9BACI|nr:hypothetical protein [Gracilibacillus sp. S3-1-1]MDX8047188.1 hypothetical protein [Gracilibacillus sp. S3-1-1]
MWNFLFVFLGIYVVSTILLFVFITYQTKKDNEEQDPLHVKIFASLALSLILTLVLMFFIFVVFGADNLVSFIFSVELDIKQLLFMSVIVVAYSLIADNLAFAVVTYFFRNMIWALTIISVIRFMLFILIGSFFSFGDTTMTILALGFTLLFLLVDIYDVTLKK